MKVRFYSFSKRKNSTIQPSSSYTEKSVVLKDNTSVHDPVLQMSGGINVSWNYAYIPTFDRYYFVKDYVSVANGITEYYLTEDVMASNKTAIGATKARIVYSTSYPEIMIPDTRIGILNSRVMNVSKSGSILDVTGCYILTIFDGINASIGMGCTYMLKQSALRSIAKWFSDQFQDLASQFFNGTAMDGVFSLIWVPFAYNSTAGTHPSEIWIGNHGMSNDGYTVPTDVRLLTGPYSTSSTVSLDCNMRYTDFRKCEPYTTGNLFLPGIGVVDVNMADFVNSTKIYVDYVKEYTTGDIFYTISNGSGLTTPYVASYTANLAAQCPLGQINTNANGAVGALSTIGGGLAAGVGAMAMGSPMGAVAAASTIMAGASALALSQNKRQVSISGNVGGRGWELLPGLDAGCIVHTEFSVDTEDPAGADYADLRGRPVCKTDLIGNYSGYIQCEGASVIMAGSELERDEINAMLNSGFYYG